MKATFKLNGVKIKKNLPVCWEETKYSEFLAYELLKKFKKDYDAADVLAIFTGIDAETLRGAKVSNLPTLLALLSFLKYQSIDYALPKEILGYKIKDNIEIEEIQRYADMEALIKDFKDGDPKNLEKYPLIVATYVVEPYNFKHAEDLAPSFLDAPAMEVLAVANFTLVNITVLNSITPVIVRLAALPRNNWKQGMRNSIARLAFSLSLFFLKRKLPTPVKRYLDGRLRSLSLT